MVIWLTSWQVDKLTSEQVACEVDMVIWLTSWQVDKWTSCLWSRHGNMVDKLTSWQVDKWTSCLWSRHGNMRTNFFFITSNLSNSSTYLVTLSFSQATCLLVYSFTCPLIMLLCLWYNQLVHPSTRSLVHLLCYSVFCKQLVYSFTCQLVNLPCYSVFFTSNLFTRLLVHLSTNCL